MDLRHLSAFVAVAEEGTFTKAARRLHISQPPLSRHVRQLEKELGVTLFLRRRDGIELTNDGYALLEKAQAAVAAVRNFEGAAHERTSHVRELCIGIGWGLWSAVDRIRTHHAKRFPDMRISAVDLCQERSRVQEREIDVAVLRGPVDEAQYDSEPLFEERFVAILGDTHPLASRKTVKLAELAAEPLLMYDRSVGPGVYDKTLELIRAAGIQPSVVGTQPPPYAQGAMMLVASRQGYYIGIASPFTQTHLTSGVAVVPLNEPNARLEVRIAWARNQISGCIREFVRSAREVFDPTRGLTRPSPAGTSRVVNLKDSAVR
ncbi:MAG TPA: LysR family transcriptional regulator [Vicinamibacterales bacterium]|nr:LysR family transcriptional regulator [Vicinamibacterales bacterium]